MAIINIDVISKIIKDIGAEITPRLDIKKMKNENEINDETSWVIVKK